MRIIVAVGFALWIADEVAWAQGRHEYRPLGVAVIARSGVFRERDFLARRPAPSPAAPGYVGLFASLGDMNRYLARVRPETSAARGRSRAPKKNFYYCPSRSL